jgi:hypothetical protein
MPAESWVTPLVGIRTIVAVDHLAHLPDERERATARTKEQSVRGRLDRYAGVDVPTTRAGPGVGHEVRAFLLDRAGTRDLGCAPLVLGGAKAGESRVRVSDRDLAELHGLNQSDHVVSLSVRRGVQPDMGSEVAEAFASASVESDDAGTCHALGSAMFDQSMRGA